MSAPSEDEQNVAVSRREALAALATYSAVLGGTATTIVTADALVSAASAYPAVCARKPWLPACPGGSPPGQGGTDGGVTGNGYGRNSRVLF